jgi:hypothetical protein
MKNIIAIFVILVVIGFSSINVFCFDTNVNSDPAHVTGITLMGELWGNANRGGFFFMTDNLPSGIDYFIVRGESELYVNRLLATLLSAKSTNSTVVINYTNDLVSFEGDVIAITIQ